MTKVVTLGMALVLSLTACAKTEAEPTVTPTEAAEATPTATSEATQEATPEPTETPAVQLTQVQKVDYLEEQNQVNEDLKAEMAAGHTLEEPFVVLNPYGNSPLSAIVLFTTETETEVEVLVKGKDAKNDVGFTFDKATEHMLPIYGLYAGETTEVILTLSDGTSKTVSIETEAIDTPLSTAEITVIEEDKIDYSKFTFANILQGGDGTYGVVAYDNAGDIRWLLKMPESTNTLKRLENGNIMVASPRLVQPLYYQSGLVEMDLCGRVYKDFIIPGGFHHDFVEMPNGNILLAGDRSDFSTVEDYVVEIDRSTGEVVYELDLATIFDPTDGGSINRSEEDWFHNNTVDYDPKSDTILLSGRHVDAVVAIDKTKKEVKWILGNPEGWKNVDKSLFFTPIDEDGTFEWQYAQHQSVFIEDGDVLLFDNGAGRTKEGSDIPKSEGDDVYSRGVRYELDTENMTVKQVWQYGKERGPEWYSVFISGIQYLGEDDYWTTSGAVRYDSDTDSYDVPFSVMGPNLKLACYWSEIKDGELIYEMKFAGSSYRSQRMSLYPEAFHFNVDTKAEYFGSLGVKKSVDPGAAFTPDTAVTPDFEMKFNQNFEMFTINGTWKETGEDAMLVLKGTDGEVLGYSIPQPSYNMSGSEEITYRGWVPKDSLEGKTYQIYLINKGTTYSTGHQVTF